MTQFFSKRRAMGLFAAVNLLALLGCQLITGTPTPAPTQASGAPATETIQALPATEVPLTTGPVFGPGNFNLSAPTVGLAELSSYRATLTITFEGTRDGQPEQWSHIYTMLVNREAAASQITVDTTGEAARQVFYAEVNGALYERKADADVGAPCTVSAVEDGDSLAQLWEPASYLAPVLGADEAGSEPVNGTPANHYTFDEHAIGAADVATSTGEVWVEAGAGYILRYTLTSTAGPDYFGEGREGTATWNYELSEINQPIAIDLPVDCPIGLLDVPLPSDAANTINIPGMINFTTALSMSEAATFYQEQLPTLGWQLLEEPSITETATLLEFSQGTQALSVIVTTDETGTTVLITAEPIVPN